MVMDEVILAPGIGGDKAMMTHNMSRGDILQEARELLGRLDEGEVSASAYDTAWVARVPASGHPDVPAFPQCLEWLRAHQHPDGSWGGEIEYYYDRVISTLAAVLALTQWDRQGRDGERCRRGLEYLYEQAKRGARDVYETVGFELILPTLLAEAAEVGLRLPPISLGRVPYQIYEERKRRKLSRIPREMLYSRLNPAVFSLEFMDGTLDAERAADLQSENGSVGNSTSATAFLLCAVGEQPAARAFVAEAVNPRTGGAVFCRPIEIFERAWVLYNLDLAGLLRDLAQEARPHVDYLRRVWDERVGVAFSRWYPICDLDDSATTFKVLRRAAQLWDAPEYRVSLDALKGYAETDHFRTFHFETDASSSSNIHLLDALVHCEEEQETRSMIDIIKIYMRRTSSLDLFWFDKWHASPYYVTAHAILAAVHMDRELIRDAVLWIQETQREDGSWGYYRASTVEETAYCLQALLVYDRQVGGIAREILHKAASYIRAHWEDQEHPPLWIAKSLFAPVNIIRSAIISALALYEEAS